MSLRQRDELDPRGRTTAFAYHDIVQDGAFSSSGFRSPDADIYKLDATEFREHLRIIQDAQAERRNRVLLTFDDGGAGAVYTAELLEQSGLRGYFFVPTDRIGATGFLEKAQIRALRRAGHIIGSHSCSHPTRMSRCPADQMDREWRESVRTLEDILGEAVTAASVPGGYYSRAVAAAAARSRIRLLFTSEPVVSITTVDGCAVKGRFGLKRGVNPTRVRALAYGRTRPRLEAFCFWNAKKVLKTIGGPSWLLARRRVLAYLADQNSRGETEAGG